MRIRVEHDIAASPDAVLVWVSDLAKFPSWTNVLHRVDAEPAHEGSPPAWQVELRGKIGPFARSKRLRMVEVPMTELGRIRFERRELDGQDHGVWNLDVRVETAPGGSTTHVHVDFEYEGRLWSTAVERLLRDEIESSKAKLSRLAIGKDHPTDQAL